MDTFTKGLIHPTAEVSSKAVLGNDVTIGAFSVIHSGVSLGDGCVVGSHCSLGEPTRDYYEAGEPASAPPCRIGPGATIRSHTVIYQGVAVGAGLDTGHRVVIREGSAIGDDVRIGTMSDIQGALQIGDHVRIHSSVFVPQQTIIEDFVWLFPRATLTNDPHPPSDSCTEGPIVRRFAVVAAGALIMPGLEIGEHSLVGAMSLVLHDVPARTVVVGAPARTLGSVHDLECRHGGLDTVYPWPTHFRRGYSDDALSSLVEFD